MEMILFLGYSNPWVSTDPGFLHPGFFQIQGFHPTASPFQFPLPSVAGYLGGQRVGIDHARRRHRRVAAGGTVRDHRWRLLFHGYSNPWVSTDPRFLQPGFFQSAGFYIQGFYKLGNLTSF